MKKIIIFSGTARKDNYTQYVAQFVKNQLETISKHQVEIVSPDSIGLKVEDETNKSNYSLLTKKITDADGFVIVAPEYNHSFPGSLKLLLDLHFNEYYRKPVMLVGVSAGPFGGTRVVEQLVTVTKAYGMVHLKSDFLVSNVAQEIVDGTVADVEKWASRLSPVVDELNWYLEKLAR